MGAMCFLLALEVSDRNMEGGIGEEEETHVKTHG
jgi:hypothetical protein